MRLLLGLVAAGVLLSGCGGSQTATPAESAAATTAATPAPSPLASDDACGLLTPDEINQVLGTTFGDGESTADESRQIVTCAYTMTDSSSGVELPVAIVNTALSLIDGEESYATNVDLAPAYFGNEARDTEVEAASKAYLVTNEETQSPVIGMLVDDRFAQIQIGVEGATDEQAQQLAAIAAARMAA